MSFHRIPKSLYKIEKRIKNDIEPIAPTVTVNRLVLEWEDRIKLHQQKEMEFNQWRSKTFKNKHPALVKVESEMKDEGEVMFLALGWYLEEIHVTWAPLENKWTRLRLYTIYLEELCIQRVEKASQASSDAVVIFQDDGDMMFIEIIKKNDDSHKEEPEEGENARVRELEVEYFDVFPTRSELAYHRYLMCGPIPSIFPRNPIIIEGCPSNLKVPCNIVYVHIEKAYIDLNSHLNIITRLLYNWIMKRKLDPWENINEGVNNFTGRIKGMHVFVGNFTYVIDFMIVEDISSIIDPRLSQVVLGKPFVEISNMTHDLPEGVVRFTNRTVEIAYKMPHKITQYNTLSDLKREHTKSVYLETRRAKEEG
ncbi:hypothetical protein Tco_0285364 [Tanacetum coccineum]